MKILIIQECGRHEANRHFRESCCLKRSFDKLGHDCTIWGAGHTNFQTPLDFNSFDLIVNLENYGDEWIPDLSNTTRPFKLIWCIDAHVRGTAPYETMFSKGQYNILAHATNDYVRESHHRWLPNCSDATLLRPIPSVAKAHKMGFCGNYVTPQRKQSVDTLSQIFGLRQDIFVIGEAMVETINSYHIHFNMNIANDINYRSFETLACGTVLLTNYNPQYEKLGFIDGENCFMYGDQRDMIMKATKLIGMLNDPSNPLATVVSNGRNLFIGKHTYDSRANQIIEMFGVNS
jgi:hypothetical protein